MDIGDSKLNPSSLIDLKAELHKKYENFRLAKLAKSAEQSKRTKFKLKNDPAKVKTEKHIPIVKPNEANDEEILALKKSRLALEVKSELYENIMSNSILIDDEQNENYLVDFQRKVLYGVPETEKEQNCTESTTDDRSKAATSYQNCKFNYDAQSKIPSHGDNEENSETRNDDDPIHYQNVQFNEVRDHGTGYFAFSEDHHKRKEQMDELNSMRQETEDRRAAKERLLKKRNTMLQSRLVKICERRNIDQSVLENYKLNSEQDSVPEPTSQDTDASIAPTPEVIEQPKKKPKVRPWDEGKDSLQYFVPESKIKSQNEWIKEMREERRSEFAPPSSYMHNT